MKSSVATKTAFFLPGVIAIIAACLILCSRDNPYDVNSDIYSAGSKPQATFVDSTITGYLYDTVGIKIICSDTAKGGTRGAIKTFYFDWNGNGAFTDSAAGTAEDTITIRKAFNARNVTAHMRAVDYDGNFSTTDSIKLTILPSNPQIVDVVAPAAVPKSVSFTIAVSATDNGGVINAFLWALNGVDYTQVTLTGSITLSFDQTGDKTIKVKARDDKNIESPERSIFIRVINPLDTIGPHIAFLSPLDHDTLRTPNILAMLQIDDENPVNVVTVNGASFQQIGNIWRGAMTLNEGANTFIATAADANNNISLDSITVYYAKSLVDTVPPLVVMIVPPKKQDTVYTAQLSFRLRALDESGVASVWLNDEVMIRDSLEDGCYVAQKALKEGMNNFVIKAADGLGNTGYDSVNVYYDTQANDTMPPTLSITSPRLYARFTDTSITVKGIVIDASGIFSLQVNGIEATINYPNWQAIVPLRYGYDTITVVAFDASAKSNKAVQSVIVVKNSAPQFTAVPSDTSLLVPTTYSVSASVIDPENGPLAFSLLPALFTSATAPTLTQSGQNITIAYTPNASGIDTFKLMVTDAWNDADTALWRVFLHLPNDSSPVFTTDVKSLPNTIIAPNTLQATVTAIDPNNLPLTYSLIRPTTPTGMTINATTGSIAWATTIADTGVKHIIVQASNGRQSDTVEWDLTVLFHNAAPVLTNPGIQTTNEGQKLSLTLIATDPNNDPLTFLFGPQFPATATLDSNRFSWTPGYSDSGRRAVTVIARERTRVPALSDTETFIITVTNVNPQTPVLVSPLNGATAQPISFALIWKKATAGVTYHLQLATDTAFKTITIQDSVIADTFKTVIGLANNTTYYWHVKAKNPGGESAWSTRENFATIVANPGVPSLIYPAHNASNVELNPMLQWSAITGANSYTVQVDDQLNFTSPVLNVAANGTSQAVTLSNGTKYYWRVNANISGIAGAWATDSFFTIFSAPVITVNPLSRTIDEGSSVSFSVTATGSQLTYQWQKRNTSSSAWGTPTGTSNQATYTIAATILTNNGWQFRCIVTNSGGSDTSAIATLTVNMVPPNIVNQPSNQNVIEGASASFSVTASGSGLAYQWQRRANSSAAWATPTGANNQATYAIASAAMSDNGAQFRCVVTNAAGIDTSNTVTLTVIMMPPTIAVQPSNQSVTVGASATFSLTANGSGTLTYQWQKNGTPITGATSATYTTPTTTIADNNAQFRCIVSNAGGNVTSNAATLTVGLNSAKALTAFSFTNPAATGTINETAHTVAVNVPYGTNVTALVAAFTTTGASVRVGTTVQISGSTANNFTSPVTYTVTAADASTQNYVVTVTVGLNSAKALTAFSFTNPAATGTIDEGAKTIAVTVPYGTNVTALVATFATTGASVRVGTTVQTSGSTANNFTSPVIYTVTAADASTQNYVVTVTVGLNSAKALTAFSFTNPAATGTIDEGAKTIAVTVPYGTNVTALVATFATTGASVRVGTTVQTSGSTANNFTSPVIYTVTAADASTQNYVVTVTVGLNSAKALTAFSFTNPAATGTIDETAHTIAATVPYGTNVTALVATFATTGASVRVGTTVQTSGSTANNFTSPVIYTVIAADASTQNYVVTVTLGLNPAKALTAFSFTNPAATGTIDEGAKTIAVTVPYGTNVTALVATFATTGASVRVGTTVQTSGSTANNFTSPVIYTVIAADASTQNYVVTVTLGLNPAKALTAFSFTNPAATGTIDEGAKTVAATVPYGTNMTALVATFATTGASVSIGSTLQTSGVTSNNFTSPVIYTVTAADASTQNYVVTVTVGLNPAKALTAFSFSNPAATGTIDEGAKTVAVTVPYGTNVTDLVATFSTTGVLVRVGSTVQSSGSTANNFTSPVIYTVIAADASTQNYVVTVTVGLNPAKALTAFSFTNPAATGTIDEGAKTVAVTVPYGTNVTDLVATFSTTGASVRVGSTVQSSGSTPNDFTTPVTYTVTAADASTQNYVVTVTVGLNPAKALTAFSFSNPAATGTINETAHTVAVNVSYGTDVTALVASFFTTGASVRVGSTVQSSGSTPNDFTTPVTYTVTAEDGTTQDYTVTVSVPLHSQTGTGSQF